jgi:putative spermidine/putrescine transport system permease protein
VSVAAERGAAAATATRPSGGRERRAPAAAALGLVPFAAYVVLFLALPTVFAVGSGFFTADGAFTTANLTALTDPVILRSFAASAELSALTAVVGAVVGALVCYALLGFRQGGMVRTIVDAVSGVLAQFGGVMLAFAFIATIGLQGLVTLWLKSALHLDLFASGPWIYDLPGLVLPYIYFQVPLMVITFLPAMTSLQPQWYEANLTLGGTPGRFWLRIAVPALTPSFLACLLLLFANAFSSYATAAALVSQGSPIVPLQIRTALTSETVLGRENVAGVLALGMVIVMALVMGLYAVVQRRATRWRA